jgi:hypothetical protein
MQAIEELYRDGWDVVENPDPESLPEPLRELRPDLIARRGSEILIGEVKSRHSVGLEHLNQLAESVANLANARLEVYWLGDAAEAEPPLDNIRDFIREASDLTRAGHLASGTLIAWAALEGAITYFAMDKDDLETWGSPWQLLSNLYSLGYISENDFQLLANLGKLRNEIAHHVSRIVPSVEGIEFILGIAERMISGRYISTDQMVQWFLEHYADPAKLVPHNSGEEKYQYRINEPYNAQEVLAENFPGATEEDLTQAVTSLEETSTEWIARDPEVDQE